MEPDEIRQKQAIKILSEKQPISKPTFVKWCNEGLIRFRLEPHGRLSYRVFKIDEIKRVKDLLPTEHTIGMPLLPRPKK